MFRILSVLNDSQPAFMVISKKYTATTSLSIEDVHNLIAANTEVKTDLEIALNTDTVDKMFMGTYTFNTFKITVPNADRKKKTTHPQIKGNVYAYNGITYIDLHYKLSSPTILAFTAIFIFFLVFISNARGFVGVFGLFIASGFFLSKLSIGGTYYADRFKLHELLLLEEVGKVKSSASTDKRADIKPDIELTKTTTRPAPSVAPTPPEKSKERPVAREATKPSTAERSHKSPPIEKPKREERRSPSRAEEKPRKSSIERSGRYNKNER